MGLLIAPLVVEGSPERAKWRREILLAANDSLFASLVYSWDQPGTYYTNSDSVAFTLRRNTDGSVVLHQPLWHTVHRMDMDTNVWSSERQSVAPLELNETFGQYALKAIPPYSHTLIRWRIDEVGLYFESRNQKKDTVLREDVLPMKDVLTRHPELSNFSFGSSPLRIAGVYALNLKYFYILLARGEPADVPCYEKILVLDGERVRSAEKRLSKRIWE